MSIEAAALRRAPWTSFGPKGHVLAFFLLACLIYLPTADYDQTQNFDVVAVAVPAWSVVERGTLDVRPYQDAAPWFFEADGRYVSNRWPGTMLFALPAYAAASPMTTPDKPVLWPATVAAALTAAAAAAVLFSLVLAMQGASVAWFSGVVAAFGTGLWTVAADSLWSHGPAVLTISLALHALRAGRQWLAGICFALLGLIRLHLLAVAAIVGYVVAREDRDLRTLLRIGLPSAVGLILYFLYARQLTGGGAFGLLPYAFSVPQGWERLTNIVGMLLAPRVGLLIYTPILLISIPRIGEAWRAAASWEKAALFGAVVYLMVQFQSNYFFGGFSFYGYRLPLEGLTFAFPMLVRSGALLVRTSRAAAVTCAALAAYSVWASGIGAVFYVGTEHKRLDPWTTYGPFEALANQPALTSVAAIVVGVMCVVTAMVVTQRRQGSGTGHPTIVGSAGSAS